MSQTLTGAQAFDPRIMSVAITIGNQIKTYSEPFWIRAKGTKYANALQNECTVEIANMITETRNEILIATSPFNKSKTVTSLSLYAGRVSTGLFLVYTGNIMTSKITQPPDIILSLKCGTAHSKKGKVGHRAGGKITLLSTLVQGSASTLGLSPHMEATDRNISNYSYSGNALDEVGNIGAMGVDAFVDDGKLVVKNKGVPLSNTAIVLSEQTGMIGIPEITEQGLKVKFLFSGNVSIGYGVVITSILNPSANGSFVIAKLNFALATRENEFYYMAECVRAKT